MEFFKELGKYSEDIILLMLRCKINGEPIGVLEKSLKLESLWNRFMDAVERDLIKRNKLHNQLEIVKKMELGK